MEKWHGKNAVVTGSSSGIGLVISKELLKEGVNVVGLARNVEKFAKIDESEDFGKLRMKQCDVSDSGSVRKAFEWIEENIGDVDILVNCAGIFVFTNILNDDETSNPSLKQTMDTNFLGTVYCAKEAHTAMVKHANYGCIVNISSVGGLYVPQPRAELQSLNTYAPSKHAVTAFSKALRNELTSSSSGKIRVTNLSPGETRTQICDSSVTGTADDYYAKNPALDPEHIAAGVIFILSLPYSVEVPQLTMRSVGGRV